MMAKNHCKPMMAATKWLPVLPSDSEAGHHRAPSGRNRMMAGKAVVLLLAALVLLSGCPATGKTVEACEDEASGILEDLCYGEKASESGDKGYCNSIESKELREECLAGEKIDAPEGGAVAGSGEGAEDGGEDGGEPAETGSGSSKGSTTGSSKSSGSSWDKSAAKEKLDAVAELGGELEETYRSYLAEEGKRKSVTKKFVDAEGGEKDGAYDDLVSLLSKENEAVAEMKAKAAALQAAAGVLEGALDKAPGDVKSAGSALTVYYEDVANKVGAFEKAVKARNGLIKSNVDALKSGNTSGIKPVNEDEDKAEAAQEALSGELAKQAPERGKVADKLV